MCCTLKSFHQTNSLILDESILFIKQFFRSIYFFTILKATLIFQCFFLPWLHSWIWGQIRQLCYLIIGRARQKNKYIRKYCDRRVWWISALISNDYCVKNNTCKNFEARIVSPWSRFQNPRDKFWAPYYRLTNYIFGFNLQVFVFIFFSPPRCCKPWVYLAGLACPCYLKWN